MSETEEYPTESKWETPIFKITQITGGYVIEYPSGTHGFAKDIQQLSEMLATEMRFWVHKEVF